MENNSSHIKVQQAYHAFASGNLQTLISNISDDIIWNDHINPSSPFYGGHKGIESFEEYVSMLINDDIAEINVHTTIVKGSRSIVLIDIKASEDYVHVLRCEGEQIIRIDIYNKLAFA